MRSVISNLSCVLQVKGKDEAEELSKDDTSFESSEGTGTPRSGSTTPGAQLGGGAAGGINKQPPKKREAARSRSAASIESSRSSTPRFVRSRKGSFTSARKRHRFQIDSRAVFAVCDLSY